MKIIFIILFGLSLCFISCSGSKEADSEKLQYSILTAESGGFTGMQQGFFIDTAGTVTSFYGKTFDTADKKELGALKEENFTELNTLINEIDTISSNQGGNIYKYIVLKRTGSDDIRISWNDLSQHSPALDRFYNKIKEITDKLK